MSEKINGKCEGCGIGSVDRFCDDCWPKCVLCGHEFESSSVQNNVCSMDCVGFEKLLASAKPIGHLSEMFAINMSHGEI